MENEQVLINNENEQQGETAEQKYQRLYGQQTSTDQQHQSQPVVAQLPPEVMQTLQAMQARLDAMAQPQQTQQVAPVITKNEWVNKIREGDFEGAQTVITNLVRQEMQPELERVRQRAYEDAMTATQVNGEMSDYLRSLRQTNQDLVKFEPYLEAPVARRVALAKQAGRIKSGTDLVREYKSAVDAEVANLRNLGLQFRADGKNEALTRNREVLGSQTLNPQQLRQMTPGSDEQAPPIETAEDYFAKRLAAERKRHGMME